MVAAWVCGELELLPSRLAVQLVSVVRLRLVARLLRLLPVLLQLRKSRLVLLRHGRGVSAASLHRWLSRQAASRSPRARAADKRSRALPRRAARTQRPDALGEQFLTEAREAFLKGDYQDALRLGGHAAVEMPRNSHRSQPADAGDVRPGRLSRRDHGSARGVEPRSADNLGNVVRLLRQHPDVHRPACALEKYAAAHKSDPGALFLLGYQYVIMGHKDAAKDQLIKSLLLAPKDRLAANLLVQIGGKIPESVAAVQRQMEHERQGRRDASKARSAGAGGK